MQTGSIRRFPGHVALTEFVLSLLLASGFVLGSSANSTTSRLLSDLARRGLGGAVDCTTPPPPDPDKGFLRNFFQSCYTLPFLTGLGGRGAGGDTNATYDVMYYRVDAGYELIVVAEYPQARFLSITAYDDHNAVADWVSDSRLMPLSSQFQNPFEPGATFREDQLYAVTVSFGGNPPDPGAIGPGCELDFDLQANTIDATRRHQGGSWNEEPSLPAWVPPHDDVGPSRAGFIMGRRYLRGEDAGAVQLSDPQLIVRDLSDGCAVPRHTVLDVLHLFTYDPAVAESWSDVTQNQVHHWYENDFLPLYCRGPDPGNAVLWHREPEWFPGANPDAVGLKGAIGNGVVDQVIAEGRCMRLRFRLPVTAKLPCPDCSLSSAEELRYWSLSFTTDGGATVFTSIADQALVADADGFVTLIVGFGATPPAYVDAEHGYTFLDLSRFERFQELSMLVGRFILPDLEFKCSPALIPFRTAEHHSLGGFMGEFAPLVDFPAGDAIPEFATPLSQEDSCGLIPPEPTHSCSP
ncbi:MAG: hypothetical protein ACE5JX_16350 [Acidobacteriota bacterium]